MSKLGYASLVLAGLLATAGWRMHQARTRGATTSPAGWKVLSCAIVLAALYTLYAYWEETWYRNKMSLLVDVDGAVVIDTRSGIREGCGAAVFALAATPRNRQLLAGLARRAQASSRPAADDFSAAGRWTPTPWVTVGDGTSLAERWLVGLACAGLGRERARLIDRALAEPGSYTLTLGEAGLILIPEHGLVVFSFQG